jgi:hypothetical protein
MAHFSRTTHRLPRLRCFFSSSAVIVPSRFAVWPAPARRDDPEILRTVRDSSTRSAVVGDLILDGWWAGPQERLSAKAPQAPSWLRSGLGPLNKLSAWPEAVPRVRQLQGPARLNRQGSSRRIRCKHKRDRRAAAVSRSSENQCLGDMAGHGDRRLNRCGWGWRAHTTRSIDCSLAQTSHARSYVTGHGSWQWSSSSL